MCGSGGSSFRVDKEGEHKITEVGPLIDSEFDKWLSKRQIPKYQKEFYNHHTGCVMRELEELHQAILCSAGDCEKGLEAYYNESKGAVKRYAGVFVSLSDCFCS